MTAVGGDGMCWEQLSVSTVASLGVAALGTLRAGTMVDGACTLGDASGLGGAILLTGAPGGCVWSGRADVGGQEGCLRRLVGIACAM